jgi:ABC-type multidrug transport system permease subunit
MNLLLATLIVFGIWVSYMWVGQATSVSMLVFFIVLIVIFTGWMYNYIDEVQAA